MRSQLLLVCGIALFSATSLSAQQKVVPKQILPKEFRSWNLSSCNSKSPAFGFWKEAGLRNVNDCEYAAGGQTVNVRLAQYNDPSSAYEVFTGLLRTGMLPAKLGQVAAFDKDMVLIQEGTFVLRTKANVSQDDLAALVQAVDAQSEKTPLPPL